jgi:hypothetical protein
MKKFILSLFLGLFFLATNTNAQISVTQWDTSSYQPAQSGSIYGWYVNLKFKDAFPATSNTFYTVSFTQSPCGSCSGFAPPGPSTNVNGLYGITLTPFNTRYFGWTCDWRTQTYGSTGYLEIRRNGDNIVSSFTAYMPGPSNYLAWPCTTSAGIQFTENPPVSGLVTVALAGSPYLNFIGTTSLEYQINSGSVVTLDTLKCPYILLDSLESGDQISTTFDVICPGGTTTKSDSYTVLGNIAPYNVAPPPVTNAVAATSTSNTAVTWALPSTLNYNYQVVPYAKKGSQWFLMSCITNATGSSTDMYRTTQGTSVNYSNSALKLAASSCLGINTSGGVKIKFGIKTFNPNADQSQPAYNQSSIVYTNEVTVR